MAEQQRTDEPIEEQAGIGTAIKRRGILAGAAALVAGIVAKQTAQPVAAAYALQGDFNNLSTGNTNVSGPGGPPPWGQPSFNAVLSAQCTVSDGIPVGVAGKAGADGTGVYGEGEQGVYGIGNVDRFSVGVRGFTSSGFAGVWATTISGSFGVYGGNTSGTYGVYGKSDAPGGAGVRGDCTGGTGVLGSVSDGYGVLGQAVTGNGVRGFAQQNHAIVGQTAQPYYGGVFGVATLTNTVGIYGSTFNGTTNVADAFAGYMDGNFVVANGVKSVAVPHADGSHRLVYCLESPEGWFEDFGEAKLVGGKAEVKFDADFATIVHTDAYHVFLTPTGGSKGIYVIGKTATGFVVREQQGGTSSLGVSYRVVAKRKDIAAKRLAKFDLPGKAKGDVKPPQVPPPPPVPPAPPLSRRLP
ncbi:MAG: hypothetical protein ACYDAR_09330 [Thermomicrobiales bacterium]